MAKLFAAPDIRKIFHAAEYDLYVLKRDCGFRFAGLFDTMLSAQLLGYPAVGLSALVERHFEQDLVGCRFEVNLSPDLQLSSLTQYDSESRELGSNSRIRFTLNRHCDIFMVYNHQEIRTRLDPAASRLLNREWQFESSQLPIKVQFAWRF